MSEAQIAAAWVVFFCSYLVFAIGKFPGLKIDRPGAAIVGAVVMVAIKVVSPANAIRSVDFATIVLLFAMMLIVATLRLAGFFDYVAERLVARLEPAHLLPAIIFTSGLLSAFFVNDIVCLVLAPFVVLISRRMRLNPVPHLLALATASNIGSVATITGNPQNMLIGSYSGISYRSFLAHLAPVAVAGLFVDWLVLWCLWRGRFAVDPVGAKAEYAGEGRYREARKMGRAQFVKPLIVMMAVLGGFLSGVPPAMMAALGAAALLVIHARDPREMYDEVDWGLLVFFVGLFVIVRGAEESGLVARMLSSFQFLNLHRPGPFSGVVVVLSNLVSNVPAVMLLKSIVPQFANARAAWLMLAMASTLAGNLTITGSVANIIVVERAREVMRNEPSADAHIGFREYARVGVPVTVLTVTLGTLWVWWSA